MMGWGDTASVEVGPGAGAVSVASSSCNSVGSAVGDARNKNSAY